MIPPLALHSTPLSETFSSYVRRVFALKFGTKCGLCGCRHRHDVYWSLRKRVCRLCMESNSISGELLSRKYGVDYSDMLIKHKGEFFFYTCNNTCGNDDRISAHGMTRAELQLKSSTYMFWLPHLKTFLDFPALYQRQNERRQAAVLLSSVVKRRWGVHQQHVFGTSKANYSIDCLLLTLYRNEKKRVTHPYGAAVSPGGPNWAFSDNHAKYLKFTSRNQLPVTRFHRLMVDYEDWVV